MPIKDLLLLDMDQNELDIKFKELVECLPNLTDEEKVDAKKWFDEKIHSIRSLVEDIVIDGDEQELAFQISTIWLQLRLEWNLYNLQMQYQTMTLGEAKAWIMIKGSCLSYLVELMERQIDSYRVFWLAKLATDPIQAASGWLTLVDRMLSVSQSTEKEVQNLINDVIQIRDYVGTVLKKEDQLKQFNEQVENLLGRTSSLAQFSLDDFKNCIETAFIKGFSKESLRFVMSYNPPADDFSIRPEISKAFLEITTAWIQNLVQSSLEKNVQERIDQSKSQHVNIIWAIEKKEGRIFLSIQDDGIGKNHLKSDISLFSVLQLEQIIENNPPLGSKMTLSAHATPISLYCIANVDPNNKLKIAFDADEITSVESNYKTMTQVMGYSCITSESGTIYILVDLAKPFNQPPLTKSTYVFLKTKEPKSGYPICLQLSSVEGFTHASLASGGALTQSPYSKGFFIYRQEVITVINSVVFVNESQSSSLREVTA